MFWGVGSGVRPALSIRPGALNKEKQKNVSCKKFLYKNHKIPCKILSEIDHKNPYFLFVEIVAQFQIGPQTVLDAHSDMSVTKHFPPTLGAC